MQPFCFRFFFLQCFSTYKAVCFCVLDCLQNCIPCLRIGRRRAHGFNGFLCFLCQSKANLEICQSLLGRVIISGRFGDRHYAGCQMVRYPLYFLIQEQHILLWIIRKFCCVRLYILRRCTAAGSCQHRRHKHGKQKNHFSHPNIPFGNSMQFIEKSGCGSKIPSETICAPLGICCILWVAGRFKLRICRQHHSQEPDPHGENCPMLTL